MPKPPSHPRYQAVARSEPYPSSANRSGGGNNNHGGGHGHSGRGSTGRMYHPTGSVSTAGVTPGVPPAHQQSAAPPNFGYGPNTGIGIGAGSGPGASGMMNNPYGSEFHAVTTTSTPRTIPRNFGQQSSPSSSSSTYGQQSFESLQGPNQPHNSSPSSVPNFQLTGYQHQNHPLQQPLQHPSLQHHRQHQHQQHQSPTITNQNAAHPNHPTQFPPQPQPQSQPQPQQNQQQHQPPSQPHHHHHHRHHHPPPPLSHNPRPNPPSPGHNPTTSWTPLEDSLLLSSRASNLPWSELQRLHFPTKSANACRKRHERLIEKRQAEEEVDEDRLARIAGEYVRMREELWKGLADRMGMDVKEVEERCLGMGVGRLRVDSRRGGRRRGERDGMPVGRRHGGFGNRGSGMGMAGTGTGAAAGFIGPGSGPVSTVMPMILGQGQGQGNGEEGRNYTHSPVQMAATGTGQSPTGPGTVPGVGMVGPGSGSGPGHGMGHGMGMGMGMLPPQTAPPLTTLIPIPSTTTTGHGYTSALPTSSAPGMSTGISPPPPLPLMQQQQPRVAFAGYLNGRSSSRRPTHPSLTSAPPSAPATVTVGATGSGGYHQGQGQQWPQHQQRNTNPDVGMGRTSEGSFAHSHAGPTTGPTSQTWHSVSGGYPPSSFG